MKLNATPALLLFSILCGCSRSAQMEDGVGAEFARSPIHNWEPASDVRFKLTETAIPALKSALATAQKGDVVIYSADWPAGICSKQHHLDLGPADASHAICVVDGVPIAYEKKYGRFIDGTVIDYGTRGFETGFILENPDLDNYAIANSESDSALMEEMLGQGYREFRESLLAGETVLLPDETQD